MLKTYCVELCGLFHGEKKKKPRSFAIDIRVSTKYSGYIVNTALY